MQIIGYLRISSPGQRDGFSLDTQLDRIKRFAEYNGHDLIYVYCDIQSGASTRHRPGLRRARIALERSDVQGLVCTSLDRLARNALDGLRFAQKLALSRKHLMIADLSLDTSTPMGNFMLATILSFAELERRTINERASSGKSMIRRKGGYVHGQPPFGWAAVRRNGGSILVPVLHEQRVRKAALKMRAEGKSYLQIAIELNKAGARSKKGKAWYAELVGEMIRRSHSGLNAWADRQE